MCSVGYSRARHYSNGRSVSVVTASARLRVCARPSFIPEEVGREGREVGGERGKKKKEKKRRRKGERGRGSCGVVQ